MSKFLLRPMSDNNSDKVLRDRKKQLINKIMYKGNNEWKGH